ncbi:hypothetical protein BDZ89DRAFT_1134187 [Hymenopellis radicata]|nr:hypothetical protein BDZ89DRAFT_1134187 [Hymenopellis radicata]
MLPLLRHVNRVARAFLYTWGASVHVLMFALYLGWIPSSHPVHAYIRIGLSGLAGAGYIMSMIWLTVVLGFVIYSVAQRFTSPDDQPSEEASMEAFQAISRGRVPLYLWCACFVAIDAVVNRPDVQSWARCPPSKGDYAGSRNGWDEANTGTCHHKTTNEAWRCILTAQLFRCFYCIHAKFSTPEPHILYVVIATLDDGSQYEVLKRYWPFDELHMSLDDPYPFPPKKSLVQVAVPSAWVNDKLISRTLFPFHGDDEVEADVGSQPIALLATHVAGAYYSGWAADKYPPARLDFSQV